MKYPPVRLSEMFAELYVLEAIERAERNAELLRTNSRVVTLSNLRKALIQLETVDIGI